MADSDVNREFAVVLKTLKSERVLEKIHAAKRRSRNLKRKLRRKRSLTKYRRYLKLSRRDKSSELCPTVSVVNIANMECAPASSHNIKFRDPMIEVSEWRKHEQIAYWKSRAISLELENKMLYFHLRDMYAHTISSNEHCNQMETTGSETLQKEAKSEIEESNKMTFKPLPKFAVEKRKAEMNELLVTKLKKLLGWKLRFS